MLSKYNSLFIVTYCVLTLLVNYSGGGMFFGTIISLILLVTITSVFVLSRSIRFILPRLRLLLVLAVSYIITFILLNFTLAAPDPQHIGIIPNLVQLYSYGSLLRLLVLPYMLTVALTFLVLYYSADETLPA